MIFREKEDTTQQVIQQADGRIEELIHFCKEPRTRQEMQEFLKIKDREHFRTKILNPLVKTGEIKLTLPDKPKSPKQKYYSK